MADARTDALETYLRKRDFTRTPEPDGSTAGKAGKARKKSALTYVIQKHAATRLHFDFRLELDGVLKSWAVTRGPSLNPADKRLAVRTEDHPLDYGRFEGVIPDGYGAGTVMLWDQGEWLPGSDPAEALARGSLKFELKGARLKGGWALVRMKGGKRDKGRENWLLIKERDAAADESFDLLETWKDSIVSGRDLKEISRVPARRKTARSPKASPLNMPMFTPPQLATPREEPPTGPEWLHELKFDGYRIQALIAGDEVRLVTRNGKDWTSRYPSVAAALSGLCSGSAAIDGELVALDSDGVSDFSALQAATEAGRDEDLTYFAFDLLSLDGRSLRGQPLEARKAALRKLLPAGDPVVRFSDHVTGGGSGIIARACGLGLEGIVSKKQTATYRSGRSSSWIKSKCVGRDEFVIGGYRRSDKKGRPFASLLVGEHEEGAFVYRGRVGAGFTDAGLESLTAAMAPLVRKTPAFGKLPAEARRDAVWITPRLVIETAYAGRTAGGLLRHARYLGLREDKAAEDVNAQPRAAPSPRVAAFDDDTEESIKGVRISSAGRLVYNNGTTKADIAHYLAEFAPRILPYLSDHPVSLVRCPSGLAEDCFFQKHVAAASPDAFGKVRIKQSDGKEADYILLETAEALVSAAQMGAVELHLWGSRADKLDYPDRFVIDLDPDEALDFADVRNAALEVRDVLASAGLTSFALLTGGKGIHVVAPLERRRPWTDIKSAARGLARQMAAAKPETYVSEMSKKKRAGRIFIDWLRNERGATAICPYSLRARQGAAIATPVRWQELPRIPSANTYTINNIRQRMKTLKQDPWKGYHDCRQSLSQTVMDFLAQ